MSESRARDGASMGTTARTLAQAKVNLFLHVLAREASGYHQLETLFCRLELGDDVVVRTNVRGRSLDCTGEAMPARGLGPAERNLAWRAALAYADATGWPNDWAIEIVKRIPVGGGLGGGSADAGAVLRSLNALAPTPVSPDALIALASSLGADVPFLTLDAPLALGWGRGERLLSLPPLPSRAVTLACFPFGVSTPEAFRWLDDSLGAPATRGRSLDVRTLTTWSDVAARAHNDFQSPVAARYASIAETLGDWGQAIARRDDRESFAMLTGSGSTVFAVADEDMLRPAVSDARGVRTVATRTAMRVVGVEVSG